MTEGSGERETRTFDGRDNNREHPDWGSAGVPLLRKEGLSASYGDGVSTPAGSDRPGAREISNGVSAQKGSILNSVGASDFLWQWGQFLDHDIDLTESAKPEEVMTVSIPEDDLHFEQPLKVKRSIYEHNSMPRQQLNEVTAWIDASQVYGSSREKADLLRTNDGTGRLRTSHGGLYLPFESATTTDEPATANATETEEMPTVNTTEGLPFEQSRNSSEPVSTKPLIKFLAGDVRVNEQAGLTTMHTLFVREHNRLADAYADAHPDADGEEIYQYARRVLGAEMQRITFEEFLPVLLGNGAIPAYSGYMPTVNPSILNSFSTAAYRFGHSALSPEILRFDAQGKVIAQGHLPLQKAFFCPGCILDEGGIEPILRGLAAQQHQEVDIYVVDDIRNILFRTSMDLVSLNIMRGRDHGLPSYISVRAALGLGEPSSFAEISSDPEVQRRLAATYGTLDKIDLWKGGLAEDHVNGGLLGKTFSTLITCQFTGLRDSDRLWYEKEGVLSADERRLVDDTTLADIIRRNTDIGRELPDDVFHVSPHTTTGPITQEVSRVVPTFSERTVSEGSPEPSNLNSGAVSVKTRTTLFVIVEAVVLLIGYALN